MRRFVAGLILAGAQAACGQAEQAQSGGEAATQAYGGVADMAQGRAEMAAEEAAPAGAGALICHGAAFPVRVAGGQKCQAAGTQA